MTNIRQVLADNMKKYRKKQGLSQAQLADKIDSATGYIANIETRKKFPSPAMIEKIAKALNVDTLDLFTTGNIMFATKDNNSAGLLLQELLDDFHQYEKTVTARLKKWQ